MLPPERLTMSLPECADKNSGLLTPKRLCHKHLTRCAHSTINPSPSLRGLTAPSLRSGSLEAPDGALELPSGVVIAASRHITRCAQLKLITNFTATFLFLTYYHLSSALPHHKPRTFQNGGNGVSPYCNPTTSSANTLILRSRASPFRAGI